jgi:hypothetical protein
MRDHQDPDGIQSVESGFTFALLGFFGSRTFRTSRQPSDFVIQKESVIRNQ